MDRIYVIVMRVFTEQTAKSIHPVAHHPALMVGLVYLQEVIHFGNASVHHYILVRPFLTKEPSIEFSFPFKALFVRSFLLVVLRIHVAQEHV